MVSTLQFLATVLAALFAMVQGVAPVDRFLWERARHYLLYVAMFVTTIYCNFKVLEVSNVETLIVARSCVPCLVALLEYAFLGRQLPSCRSWLAMLVMCSDAVGYVMSDAGLDGRVDSIHLDHSLLSRGSSGIRLRQAYRWPTPRLWKHVGSDAVHQHYLHPPDGRYRAPLW